MVWIDELLLKVPEEELYRSGVIAVRGTNHKVDAQLAQHLPRLNRDMILGPIE